ncbi:sigma 54-interacting transcriptional regulator [Sporomusa acidovorans]|uniref:Anaerobic nitric oxide reductase transcription regulator NorR n=1 Tax=Sporomusa acidovorans (strain ATCC 49682 / DSM 3132 / Mol) TaxID=1123286 RepID=A0ABZ3J5L1_SPOA4|nr:sigma 54-interacting transcriptional regulator [Sporomusa acidovorans]OZC15635.1 limonene hydroxylase [Sporomusa acidovorans DSM 3132]SDE87914.1 Transcriptional regulator containing PAS, AAA-type ATPase, and DNA-binding Fis domains [Sporomusa acidovorans]
MTKMTVKLQDLIDSLFLQQFQDNFALSVGVASVIEDNQGNTVTCPSCFSKLCKEIIRASPLGLKRCLDADIYGATEAVRTGRPTIYSCHAGLIDFAAPILLNGQVIGTIFGGQLLTKEPAKEHCHKIAQEIGVQADNYMAAIQEIPIVAKEKVQAAASVLFSVANTLSKYAYQSLMLKKSNREIVLSYNRLENIFNTMSDGVLMIDDQGIVQQLNVIAEEIFDRPGCELIHKSITELMGSNTPFIENVYKRQTAYNDFEIFIDANVGRLHCLSSGRPIVDDEGMLSGGVIILRPIKKVRSLINRLSGAQATFRFSDIIGQCPAIKKTVHLASQAAAGMASILIEGESGTGKEVFAQAIHNQSSRRAGPFVAVNCGAIPRELMISELFGYIEGAFTGAKRGGRPGKFEFASGGTIFLDEIGDTPLELQVALLRVIQERNITRMGDNKVIPVDLRIICATNKNLAQEVQQGNFRQDLYYRLNVISLKIPPLRERQEDIPLIFKYMLTTMGREWGKIFTKIDPRVMPILQKYHWPGNVRELQNAVERIISVADEDTIFPEHLPDHIVNYQSFAIHQSNSPGILCERERIKQNLNEKERLQILDYLLKANGNISHAAKQMGMARSTMYRKMRQYDISY